MPPSGQFWAHAAPIRPSFNHVTLDLNNFYTQKWHSKQQQPPKALI
jgi:hypothetical protein